MELLGSLLLLAFLVGIYALPSCVAAFRNHQSTNSIVVVNVFFGWTLLGWVVCLAWAVGPVRK